MFIISTQYLALYIRSFSTQFLTRERPFHYQHTVLDTWHLCSVSLKSTSHLKFVVPQSVDVSVLILWNVRLDMITQQLTRVCRNADLAFSFCDIITQSVTGGAVTSSLTGGAVAQSMRRPTLTQQQQDGACFMDWTLGICADENGITCPMKWNMKWG